MEYSKSALNNMTMAYKRVFGVTSEDIKQEQHQKILKNAIVEVSQYDKLFPDETEELAEIRRDDENSLAGKPLNLANHFKRLYPEEFDKKPNWDIIYIMYSRMTSSDTTEEVPAENNEEVTAEPVVDDSDIKTTVTEDNSNTENEKVEVVKENENVKENKIMAMGLEDAKKQIAGGTQVSVGSNVKPSDDLANAARDYVKNNSASLLANSKNTVVKKIILSGRPQKERLVNPENPTGKIDSAKFDEVWKKFKDVSGYNEETDTFDSDKIAPNEEDNARKTMNLIKAAKLDPDYAIPINESKSIGSIKGFDVTTTDGDDLMDKDKLREFIFNNTIGEIKTSCPTTSVYIDKGTAIRKKKKAKASDSMVDASQITDIGAVMVLKFIGKKNMLADQANVGYWKEVNPKKKGLQTGPKSAQGFKYKTKNKDGEDKVMTYRIPLVAEMYESELVEQYKVFGTGRSAANAVPTNFDDPTELQAQLDKFADLAALIGQTSVKLNLADDLRVAASDIKGASDKAAEEEFN